MVRGSHGAIEDAIGRTAVRTSDFLAHDAGAVRDALAGQVAGPAFTGSARIIDGGTQEVCGARLCLHGIDAPEISQR